MWIAADRNVGVPEGGGVIIKYATLDRAIANLYGISVAS
jgi:hypothetical protein